jgi:sugar lactone lactonase YvrE
MADAYGDARNELLANYQQGDFAAMRVAANNALAARPGYPGALFNLALAQALDDDPSASLETLQDLLAVGIDLGVADIDEFAELRNLHGWADYAAAVERLYEPVGYAEVVETLAVPDFIPEGIAADAGGRLYLGSIRHGELIRFGDPADGGPAEKLSTPKNGHWSVFGMRFDSDGGLWFASAAVPQFLGAADEAGRSGLFRYDLKKGLISDRALLPAADEAQVLGDLVIAGDGQIYTSDSRNGRLYRFDPDSGEFDILVDRGFLGSPQGLVLDRTGRFLYVADYIGGLYRVALADGRIERVRVQTDVSDFGIDGLYRYGAELIAVQNGIQPNRIIALSLGRQGLSITASRTIAANLEGFDEPTLGFVAGDDFVFVANSHWNRFGADNSLPGELSGPIILRVSLIPL